MSQEHVPAQSAAPQESAEDTAGTTAGTAAGITADARAEDTSERDLIVVRRVRHPKFSVFIGSGVALGIVVGILLAVRAGDAGAAYTWKVKLGYLCAVFGLAGGVLGATVAVILDRPKKR